MYLLSFLFRVLFESQRHTSAVSAPHYFMSRLGCFLDSSFGTTVARKQKQHVKFPLASLPRSCPTPSCCNFRAISTKVEEEVRTDPELLLVARSRSARGVARKPTTFAPAYVMSTDYGLHWPLSPPLLDIHNIRSNSNKSPSDTYHAPVQRRLHCGQQKGTFLFGNKPKSNIFSFLPMSSGPS